MVDMEGLPSKPRVPTYFHVVPMTGDRIQLRAPHKTVIMSGSSVKAVTKLLSLLDGTREVQQVLECFPEIPREQVLHTLKTFLEKGLIGDAVPDNGAQETFFSIAHRDGRIAQDLLRKARVVVFGLGRVGSHVIASLARAGIGQIVGIDDGVVDPSLPSCGGLYLAGDTGRPRLDVVTERLAALSSHSRFEPVRAGGPAGSLEDDEAASIIRGADLVLVCQDSPAISIYRTVNRAALKENTRWLRVSLEGFEAQLGPCVVPHETACYTCCEFRSRGNWPHYDENLAFEEYLSSGAGNADYGCLAPTPGLLGSLAALEAMKLLTGFSYPITCGKIWVFDINTFEARSHVVLKLPRCPSCGFTAGNPGQAQWAL